MGDLIDVSLRLAGQSVRDYADQSVRNHPDELLRDHAAAMACRDCEAMIESGLRAQHHIRFVEQVLREADLEGLLDLTTERLNAIGSHYEYWLIAYDANEPMIDGTIRRGYSPDNLDRYRDARADVIETLQRMEWLRMAAEDLSARFDAEPWCAGLAGRGVSL